MEGTNYDKFYVDELVKRYPTQEQLDALIATIKEIGAQPSVPEYVEKFLAIVETEKERTKRLEKEDSEKRQKEA